MSTRFKTLLATVLTVALPVQIAAAGDSVQHSGRALEHSTRAAGHSLAGGASLVSGVAAVPFLASGQVGRVSQGIGQDLRDAADGGAGVALPLTEEVITVGPPPGEVLERPEPAR
jgi:hypothetical protein